ncbi:hypothetical protein H257_17679 [Aphanomyces astaci]|uniref:Uncharacterized protein n=1 Tax=Aphanomyces astaci TaxID=112090 RepID=W4FDT3_APHAT|nr:hypothetical protein H257_17679 [Aphanomyces astaci]ETV65620.1 hypothetical protein H257_17679 [Aphanomyces astaci]|eukprot:XP_009844859.1 hypothetical protein H257_17679 [Aphanomyces astaci]
MSDRLGWFSLTSDNRGLGLARSHWSVSLKSNLLGWLGGISLARSYWIFRLTGDNRSFSLARDNPNLTGSHWSLGVAGGGLAGDWLFPNTWYVRCLVDHEIGHDGGGGDRSGGVRGCIMRTRHLGQHLSLAVEHAGATGDH